MPDKFITMTPDLHRYLVAHGSREDDLLRRLAAETEALGRIAMMQISPVQGALMSLLARSIRARDAIEVGTFTGYSAISIARALPPDGKLITCDVSEEWTAIARRYFREAGLEAKVDVRLGPALDTLRALPSEELFDFGFIDADKTAYGDYYEEILRRLRRGGLLLIDNVLWGGSVADPADQSESVRAIRELNDRVIGDRRVDVAMVPVSDGVTVVRKR
ncbi:MAG: O-methyltransferase [Candidatus Binatia bacterium]